MFAKYSTTLEIIKKKQKYVCMLQKVVQNVMSLQTKCNLWKSIDGKWVKWAILSSKSKSSIQAVGLKTSVADLVHFFYPDPGDPKKTRSGSVRILHRYVFDVYGIFVLNLSILWPFKLKIKNYFFETVF